MTDAEIMEELAELKRRLAALAAHPQRPDIAAELGTIRAQLQELAARNESVAARLSNAFDGLPDQ